MKTLTHFVTFLTLTGEDNEEDDGNIDEEELEVSKVTEDLRTKSNRKHSPHQKHSYSSATIYCRSSFTHRVEKGDTDVLDDAVEGHELEHTKGGDESSTSLPVTEKQTLLP